MRARQRVPRAYTAAALASIPLILAARSAQAEAIGPVDGFAFTMLALFLLAGAWWWLVVLLKKGPRALLGRERMVVNAFESVVAYRDGAFERVLTPGIHWVNPRHAQFIKVDLRPEVFQIAQGTTTADRMAANLRCTARVQIRDPRAAVERAKDYRAEVYASLQSIIKKMGEERTLRELLMRQDEFNAAAKALATQSVSAVGVECVGFELLHAESSSQLPDLETKDVGFRSH